MMKYLSKYIFKHFRQLKKGISVVVLLLVATYLCASDATYRWISPSSNSSESMPCGGGDIGLNVWVENGDLMFYISRSGTFDENNTLLKQGRVRVQLHPNPFLSGNDFYQELNMEKGSMTVTSGGVKVVLWADVFKPVVHVEIESKRRIESTVYYENWRYRDRLIRKGEGQQNSYKWAAPEHLAVKADTVKVVGNSVVFYHQNAAETVFDVVVAQQGMESVKTEMMNPLANLVSGGKMWGDNLRFVGTEMGEYAGTDYKAWKLSSVKPFTRQSLTIALHTEQTPSAIDWEQNLTKTISKVQRNNDRKLSQAWWSEFWNRSFVRIGGENATISRNYTLFRYMLGCNAYGTSPTKFNGGLFTFDPVGVDLAQAFTPDYRKWGGGTMTAQNQRLVYWPMLKSGDFDMMPSQFDFYNNMLRNAELRSQVYWGHKGACFAEQIENFGLPNPSEYGWKRPDYFDKGVEYNAWLEYEWETILEFCQMILDTKTYHNADVSKYMPLVESAVTFFDEHYRYRASRRGRRTLDGNGHLIIFPSSACETYKMANNPVTVVAGLMSVLQSLGTKDSMLKTIPPISFRQIDGKTILSPAKSWERVNNTESPQLYPVFPWRMYGVGKKDIDIARNTYWYDPDVLKFRSHVGWKQDNIFAACLGLTEEAQRLTLLKLGDGPHRFPAFWGPGFDWTPDHNWGGSGMIGLQEMLMQTHDDGKILLFPAWPADWNVHFKLHAPHQTTVEAELKDGKVVRLNVFPESRKADIVLMLQGE